MLCSHMFLLVQKYQGGEILINNVVLMGRIVADPELRTTPAGNSVTAFSIAVDRDYVKVGEERQADFIDIVAWRGTAEFICKYFQKGQLIAVQGSIQIRSYTDSHGNKRKAVEVLAERVSFCGRKESKENPDSKTPNEKSEKSADVIPEEDPPHQSKIEDFTPTDFSDDDLPF